MKKKLLSILILAIISIGLCACTKEKKTVTCDKCGAEIVLPADSNVTDEWTVYCHDCEQELGLDKIE